MDPRECSRILVSSSETHGLVVYLSGRFTMNESWQFQEFLCQTLSSDKQLASIVDLNECEYLDSTFLGCLVKIHKQFPARLVLSANEESSARLLQTCHLHRLFQFLSTPLTDVTTEPICLSTPSMDRVDFGHHVLDCHRQLAEIASPSQAAFHRIVEHLEQELGEH